MACDFAHPTTSRAFSRRNPGTENYSIVGLRCCKSLRSSLFFLDYTFLGFGCCDRLSLCARVVATSDFIVLGGLMLQRLGFPGLQPSLALFMNFLVLGRLG